MSERRLFQGDRVRWRQQEGVVSDDYWWWKDRYTVDFIDGSDSDFSADVLQLLPARKGE